ncbi:MAG: hypothetical protein L6Q99_10365 [Planctomycetes bacterium]|nr:hypothetical protein [Planctomycetota bacterium]
MNSWPPEPSPDLPANLPHVARASLCARCRHVQFVESAKGSVFLLCGLAKSDPRFPKYPPQPLLACRGFVARP